jgi:hypothetical protein
LIVIHHQKMRAVGSVHRLMVKQNHLGLRYIDINGSPL